MSDLEKALLMVENLIKELKILNENLDDIKRIIAPYLGWKIIEEKNNQSNPNCP